MNKKQLRAMFYNAEATQCEHLHLFETIQFECGDQGPRGSRLTKNRDRRSKSLDTVPLIKTLLENVLHKTVHTLITVSNPNLIENLFLPKYFAGSEN
jgi:hypothetical protein